MNSISNTINMTIRIDKDLKKNVDNLFKKLGTNTSSAINMFLRQCDREQGLVFTPTLTPEPSEELLEALKEGEKIIQEVREGKRKGYNNVNEMMRAILDD